MQSLVLHSDCESGPVRSVSAELHPTAHGCEVEFRLEGDISSIKVPAHQNADRADNLWKTTCFEIFWQPIGDSYYREFNLSPSSRWACYDFDDFREGMRDAPVNAIAIASAKDDTQMTLKANVASELSVPAQVALNAIVEDAEGNIQFWALAFPDGKAEFHSETCRQLHVEARP